MLYHNLTVLALLVRSPCIPEMGWVFDSEPWLSITSRFLVSCFRSQVEIGSHDEGAFLQEARSPHGQWDELTSQHCFQQPSFLQLCPSRGLLARTQEWVQLLGVLLLPSAGHCSPACAGKEHRLLLTRTAPDAYLSK